MSKRVEMNMVAIAIDRDKGSQIALKWAVDNLMPKTKGKSANASLPAAITFLHVKHKSSHSSGSNESATTAANGQAKDVFLPFRCFCTRKDIKVHEIVLEDTDVARALCNYAKSSKIENLVIGSSVKNGFIRKLKNVDISGNVLKGAPDFCNVYVISKGKVASERLASATWSHLTQSERSMHGQGQIGAFMSPFGAKANSLENLDSIKSPFTNINSMRSYGEFSLADSDISFVSSGRPSSDRLSATIEQDLMMVPRLSCGSETDNRLSTGSEINNCFALQSGSSQGSMNNSWSSGTQNMDDMESEMRRLKQELKQTIDMYSSACKEALTAKQKAMELQRWKVEELQKIEEARLSEGAALAIAEQEKEKCRAAIQKAEASQRLAEQEAQRRKNAEMKAVKAADEKKKVLEKLAQNDARYRRYSIEEIEAATEHFAVSRKVGEGGYGPVYKCSLDHTPVAVKVLRPDATQGRSQFQQEVEVLSCMRHPNMVLLLGACPEYGCLVYEYMAKGSLEDCLLRKGNTPVLPWQLRFRIAAEIGTALLFLHQTKPEPLVHRDLKPANILLDHNFVSKISDVGLARLVPASVADTVTQYRMTSAAGTFCYIDPEYQQTGMLGTKSDIYSLGVMLLQIITAKPPMGLTHHVERAIENGTFVNMLDPQVKDWPLEDTLSFAKMALGCVELRRKDRPDLGTVVLPELNRLRELGEKKMPNFK